MTPKEDTLLDILDYLKGEASEEQIENLQEWLTLDSDNKKTYREIVQNYYRMNNVRNWDQINEFEAKRKVEEKLIAKRKFPYWSIAASVVLLIGLSVTLLLSDYSKEEQVAKTILIEPGKKGAELILSTGERVQIMSTQKLLKETNGALVQVDSLAGVVYESKEISSKELIYNTIKVARGQEFNLQLADGTKVWLNADSELRYPVQFVENTRKVYLKGEAYFEVAHNREKAFIVNSFQQDIKVYGTKFNVNAYNRNLIQTVLVEGSVGVSMENLNKEQRMIPGDLLTANAVSNSMITKKVDVYPYIAWKDGNFLFQNESVEEIMLRLERWYNVKVFFEDNSARGVLFSGDMKRYTKIDKLLYFMEKSSNMRFTINDDVIIVKSK
ncbi:hypothetical protein BZG02_10005 [Labilibaculum filiforme]|uniref:FecR family protein n=1 Tax=Labilibaculum filiforme TaxID=1940526 RepID=A0A2N3HYH3_9BACT|nr:FecR family protein [Labilibaculum filiforme]PKQ63091.1 hypothetical protein BZG02_10005 [Labilibaculum filiforme]